MQSVAGMEKKDGVPVLGQSRGDLGANVTGLADAGDDDFPLAALNQFDRANEIVIEAVDDATESLAASFLQYLGGTIGATACLNSRCSKLPLTRSSISLTVLRRDSKFSSAKELGPSLNAWSGPRELP